MSQPFDHNRLHSLLEEADRFLQGEGRHEYAQAVSTALSILIDEIGRMAEGRRVAKKLREIGEHPPSALVTGEEGVRDRVRQLAYVMEQYVTQAVGPWIGTPLFAKDWPDGALADEPVLVLTKECEEAQREIARLRRDADAYDSRISALLSSEHGLKKEVAALRRLAAERAADPDGLEDIAQQARNNFTEEDLDVLDAHRAALWDAGDVRVGQPLSMVLAVLTRLIRWKGKETP